MWTRPAVQDPFFGRGLRLEVAINCMSQDISHAWAELARGPVDTLAPLTTNQQRMEEKMVFWK